MEAFFAGLCLTPANFDGEGRPRVLQTCTILGAGITVLSTPGTKLGSCVGNSPDNNPKNKEAARLAPRSPRKPRAPEAKGLFFYSQAAKPSSSPHSLPPVKLRKPSVNLGELGFCTEEFYIPDLLSPLPSLLP